MDGKEAMEVAPWLFSQAKSCSPMPVSCNEGRPAATSLPQGHSLQVDVLKGTGFSPYVKTQQNQKGFSP
jgi:hypothetical protein